MIYDCLEAFSIIFQGKVFFWDIHIYSHLFVMFYNNLFPAQKDMVGCTLFSATPMYGNYHIHDAYGDLAINMHHQCKYLASLCVV